MSTLRYLPLEALALALKERCALNTFVETGTYQGETTSWGAEHFNEVHTIDIRDTCASAASEKCGAFTNVQFYLGDARMVLPGVIDGLLGPALFWLDAHNAAHLFGPGEDDCPILEELAAIRTSKFKHAILIDDAHCFMEPVPYDATKWPTVTQIKTVADEMGYLMRVAHDVIALVPPDCEDLLESFGPTNVASALIDIKSVAGRRFSINLSPPKFKVRATMVQGPASDPVVPKSQRIAEIVNTRYGLMMVPIYDINQTPPLRSAGCALNQSQVDLLVSLMKRRPGGVFLDVGANVGVFSFAMQPYCSRIYAFEPQRMLANMINGSIALNGWRNVYCNNYAIGGRMDKIEVPQFDYTKDLSFGSIEFGPEQIEVLDQERQHDPAAVEFVAVVPLDGVSYARIDMIKIDVEGMEMEVLHGGRNTIMLHKPILFIEHDKVKPPGAVREMIESFDIYDISDLGSDYLCTPKKGI